MGDIEQQWQFVLHHSDEEIEFMHAMQHYKQQSGRMFPTWSEVLEVLGSLGYRKQRGQGSGGL